MDSVARKRFVLLTLAAPLLCGCSVELGGHGGVGGQIRAPSAPVHGAWATHVGASTVYRPSPASRAGLFLGAELESRSEAAVGSRWTSGLQLGFGYLPDQQPGAWGVELHLDGGSRLAHASLFPEGDRYWGGTAAAVTWVFPRREQIDVNNELWLMTRALEVVFYGRGRIHYDHPGAGAGSVKRYDAGLGFALRSRFVSDLM